MGKKSLLKEAMKLKIKTSSFYSCQLVTDLAEDRFVLSSVQQRFVTLIYDYPSNFANSLTILQVWTLEVKWTIKPKLLISFHSSRNGQKIPFQHANRNGIPPCSTSEQFSGCSGHFGWFWAILTEIMNLAGMSFIWKKKLTDYKEKSYEP